MDFNSMSEKDKNLLIIVFSAIAVILIWRLGIAPLNKTVSEKAAEVATLDSKADDMKQVIDDNVNIDQFIADEKVKRENESFLIKDIDDNWLARVILDAKATAELDGDIDIMGISNPTVKEVKAFSFGNAPLSYNLRNQLALIDQDEYTEYNNEIINSVSSDDISEVTTVQSASDKVKEMADEAELDVQDSADDGEAVAAEAGNPEDRTIPYYHLNLRLDGEIKDAIRLASAINARNQSFVVTSIVNVNNADSFHYTGMDIDVYYTH